MSEFSIETINENTKMIDMELFGVKRAGALYLINPTTIVVNNKT